MRTGRTASCVSRLGQQAGGVGIEYGKEGIAERVEVSGDYTLLTYAHQFCNSTTVVLPARPDLYAQGVRPDQFYAINEAASRVYCQNRIATPPTK